jgi:hypothetical protein
MMAMDKDVLGLALAQVVVNASSLPPAPDQLLNIQQYWKDIADALISHIQEYAEVPSGIALQAGSESGATIEAGRVE